MPFKAGEQVYYKGCAQCAGLVLAAHRGADGRLSYLVDFGADSMAEPPARWCEEFELTPAQSIADED
jgi:hypothetical protein